MFLFWCIQKIKGSQLFYTYDDNPGVCSEKWHDVTFFYNQPYVSLDWFYALVPMTLTCCFDYLIVIFKFLPATLFHPIFLMEFNGFLL